MRVDQVFAKAGFEITGATPNGKEELIFTVRVPTRDAIIPQRWRAMLEHILAHAEDVASKQKVKWAIDISKKFYAKNGNVRYIWRVVMSGDLRSCQEALTQATINALRTGREVTEVPLIGQTNMTPDPKNGKFKGAYPRNDEDQGTQAVAAAFIAG